MGIGAAVAGMSAGTAAAVGAGGAIVGGAIAADGAKDAAETQAAGYDRATAEQRRQFDITQEQQAPWLEAGQRGLESYEKMLGQYKDYENLIPSNLRDPFKFGAAEFEQYKDPGYDYRLSEGLRALDRQSAAGGKLMSGQRLMALQERGQEMGSQEFGAARNRAYQDYSSDVAREAEEYNRGLSAYGRMYTDPMSRYGNLAGVGQQTATNLGQMRSDYANQVGQNMVGSAQSTAAGQLGSAGAWSSAIGDIGRGLSNMYAPQTGTQAFGSGYSFGAAPGAPTQWVNPG